MPEYWKMLLVVTVVPFALGLALLFLMPRLKWAGAQVSAFISGVCCLLVFLFYSVHAGPYVWAIHLESKWRPVEPQTKAELESFLSLYTESVLAPGVPSWGNDHEYRPGERMVRYNILFNAPLDVVYSADDRLVAIYTTYE